MRSEETRTNVMLGKRRRTSSMADFKRTLHWLSLRIAEPPSIDVLLGKRGLVGSKNATGMLEKVIPKH